MTGCREEIRDIDFCSTIKDPLLEFFAVQGDGEIAIVRKVVLVGQIPANRFFRLERGVTTASTRIVAVIIRRLTNTNTERCIHLIHSRTRHGLGTTDSDGLLIIDRDAQVEARQQVGVVMANSLFDQIATVACEAG